MKRITAKIIASFVLIFSVVFAGLSIANLTSNPAYALPDSPETPSDITDPSDPTLPNENPDEEPNPDQTPSDTTDPTDSNKPEDDNNAENDTQNEDETESTGSVCTSQAGSLSWIVCPTTQLIGNVVDAVYGIIGDFLVVSPISTDSDSPIYIVWQYIRNLTNIVFIIFLFIVILSQFTSVGISNYGVKRILPRLIIAVILMNLSFLICALLVDVSNIAGSSLRGFFDTLQTNMLASVESQIEGVELSALTIVNIVTTILAGGGLAGFVIGATGGIGALLCTLGIFLLGGIVAVITGLITIAGRQAVIALLIMIAPLAFATYLLPNTERWFTSWKNLLARMLIFFPAFSFLYGASKLVGWAIIASSTNGFGVVLGLAVQIFPLFFSWSLMKMSGTVLGSLNNALRKVAAPLQGVGTRWAGEHAEQKRQNYIANNHASSGARLRRYLDYRRKLRLEDTKNAATSREDQATERAMKKMSSIIGRDEEGNTVWEVTPNRYTRTAKSASYHHTLATNATMAYQNTLSGYGRHFKDVRSARLSASTGHAYEETMAQQFLAANEAEADQQDLLNAYLKAKNNLKTNPYQYNRLIRDAAGGLGHNGESSIMGQVIQGNSAIENRRRTEARIMINKFGMEKHKQEFRWMVLDKKVNDDGFAIDRRNEVIEDDQYNLLPGKQYAHWDRYIGVHKKTGDEITKEQYDHLSDTERDQYRKVKYFDITDDHGNDVQRVFEDDAGYMKELLTDDIMIADPIAQRFLAEIFVSRDPNRPDGKLRRYHSTIRTATDTGGINGHGAGITPLLTSAANAGWMDSMGQFNITTLQSLAVAMKPGNLQKNDAFYIDQYRKIVESIRYPEKFARYFPDEAILHGTTNNHIPLPGLEAATRATLDNDGNPLFNEDGTPRLEQYWHTVNYQDVDAIAATDPARATELRKNFIKHNYMKKAIISLVGAVNRQMTPDVLASLKPGAVPALKKLGAALKELGLWTLNPDTPFEDRIDGNTNIYEVPDSQDICRSVQEAQDEIYQKYGIVSNSTRQTSRRQQRSSAPRGIDLDDLPDDFTGENYQQQQASRSRQSQRKAINDFGDMLEREIAYREHNSAEKVINAVQGCFVAAHAAKSLDLLLTDIESPFEEFECLRDDDDIHKSFLEILNKYKAMPHASSHEEGTAQIVTPYEAYGKKYIEAMEQEIMELIYRAKTY